MKLIDANICDSYNRERLHNEKRATDKIKTDSNYFFKYAKQSSKSHSSIGPMRDHNDSLTQDPKLMCNLLINQYDSVFSDPIVSKCVDDPVTFFATSTAHNKLTNIIINEDMIIDSIKEISRNSSAGPDGMPANLFKECGVELAKPLKKLFSLSIKNGHVPQSWKDAAIVPIHKGGDRSMPKNYRPISLTSIMMKIFERIIRKQLVNFLNVNNLLNPTQHGFRQGRSCLSALLNVYDNILSMLSSAKNDSCIDMIYLDYAKAFDKVDHGVLPHKM